MHFYSTADPHLRVDLRRAVLEGLAPGGGLYLPETLRPLPATFFDRLPDLSFPELATEVALQLLGDSLPATDLRKIVHRAIDFDAPLHKLDDQRQVLELFHGPTLAFKDFGARFMAGLMGWLNRGEDQALTILVATSGDTGGAVAAGFYQTPGIEVVILYPQGKVSPLQEKQLTTLGHNITALEIDGTFDDCQRMVKAAFSDRELAQQCRLSSANSINIARLIPQAFYYFRAYQQWDGAQPPVFCVPSGNFGNLTAGLLAHRLGLPVQHFIAATNVNDVVPEYLETASFHPRPSVPTLSNAMDVGNPSNFARMLALFGGSHPAMQAQIYGARYTDLQTRAGIREVFERYGYQIDPHGAVGYLALRDYQVQHPDAAGIILETAHPAKFPEVVEAETGQSVPMPPQLAALAEREKVATPLPADVAALRDWLLARP
ncbi:MAG: threonine synthase [Bacteroidetes bacterium]|nr:MAG: threonine synthase [Bacteroidota bacterium]